MITTAKARTKSKQGVPRKAGARVRKYAPVDGALIGVAEQRAASPIYLEQAELFDSVTVIPRKRDARRIAFGWYGGKFSHLEWLLPLLPRAHHYCEPFSGSAAVLLNREP